MPCVRRGTWQRCGQMVTVWRVVRVWGNCGQNRERLKGCSWGVRMGAVAAGFGSRALRLVLVDDLGLRGAHYVLAALLGGGAYYKGGAPGGAVVPPSDGVAPALDRPARRSRARRPSCR